MALERFKTHNIGQDIDNVASYEEKDVLTAKARLEEADTAEKMAEANLLRFNEINGVPSAGIF